MVIHSILFPQSVVLQEKLVVILSLGLCVSIPTYHIYNSVTFGAQRVD